MTDSPYSSKNPQRRLRWSPSALDAMHCPRHYQLAYLEGWRGATVDLDFGGFLADALAIYQKGRVDGLSREEALMPALKHLLAASWNEDGTQWGGSYEDQWKCAGTEPYKNAKGNRAVCPYAHKAAWFPGSPPDICGECGSAIVTARNYLPDDPKKNRPSLVSALIWYVLDQPEDLDQGLRAPEVTGGVYAVEMAYELPLPMLSPDNEQYTLSGRIDYGGQFGDEVGPVDNKTTKNTLGTRFFDGYCPSTQFDTYDLAWSYLFGPGDWVCCDAIQVLSDCKVRTDRAFYRKTDEMREEHLKGVLWTIKKAELCAEAGYWPMEKHGCYGCAFKRVCGSAPETRAAVLEQNFTKTET